VNLRKKIDNLNLESEKRIHGIYFFYLCVSLSDRTFRVASHHRKDLKSFFYVVERLFFTSSRNVFSGKLIFSHLSYATILLSHPPLHPTTRQDEDTHLKIKMHIFFLLSPLILCKTVSSRFSFHFSF
jgi:hypothetical protein